MLVEDDWWAQSSAAAPGAAALVNSLRVPVNTGHTEPPSHVTSNSTMSTKKRGRPKKVVPKEVEEQEVEPVKNVDEETNVEWSKVVESTATSYNPDAVRSKQVEIAKVRVSVNEAKEELETAVAANDFVKAQEVKVNLDHMAVEQTALEKELKALREGDNSSKSTPKTLSRENSNSRDSIVPVVARFSAVFEDQDDPEDEDEDDTDDEFAPPGAPKKKKRKTGPVKKVKRLKKTKPKAPTFLPESIVGKYSVLIHREDPEYEKEFKDDSPEQLDDLTKIDDCDENPNFALVVDFLSRFGSMVGLRGIATKDLQLMLCAQGLPHNDLVQVHMVMLRKIKLPKIIVTKKSWEKALIVFCKEAGYLKQESVELSRLGYAGLGLSGRLELLKRLMEAQFDWNDHVRMEVEELAAEVLRQEPAGRDMEGQVYWAQIDEIADIRVYSEDFRYYTWGSIAQSRQEVVSLVERLKEDKLYKKEIERLKVAREKKEAEGDIVDAIKDMESSLKEESTTESKVFIFNCEVCSQKFESRGELMGHHSSGHMAMHLQTKFSHLVDKNQCKICKFEASNESLIWVHIGTDHDKVNAVLKENGLKPIEDTSVQDEPITSLCPPADNQGTLKKIIDNEEEVIKKLEMKIDQLKHQMGDNEDIDETAEESASNQVPNKGADDDVKSPRKRGRSKESKRKSKGKSSSRSTSKGKQNKSKEKEEEPTNGSNKNIEDSETGGRPSRKCKELTEAVKAAEFSFKKPLSSSSLKSSNPVSAKTSSGESSDQEETLENISDFLEETSLKKERTKLDEEEDSGFESKDRKDDTESDESKSSQASPSKRSRRCKNKSYNDDDPFGETEPETNPVIEDKVTKVEKDLVESKIIDVSKAHVKERKETKLSCRKCNEWKDDLGVVYPCPSCSQGWHQQCAAPPLDQEPDAAWRCPLCQHIALIAGLEKVLVDLDLKMEDAEEKRLAALTENQSLTKGVEEEEEEEHEDEDDDEDDVRTRSPTKSPKLTIQNNSPEMRDVRPNYCELSDDEDDPKKKVSVYRPDYNEMSTDDEISEDEAATIQAIAKNVCACEGKGICLCCKRMKGCTCEGTGTCRLCMSTLVIDEEGVSLRDRSSSPELQVIEPPQMSTTELFLLTGQTRQQETPPPALEFVPGPGRGRGRGRGRARGGAARGGMIRGGFQGQVSPPGQVTLVDSQTLRPTGMRASLRPRGRVVSHGGEMRPRMMQPRMVPPGAQGGQHFGARPRPPRMARPDTFESGVVVRGGVRPMRAMRPPRGQPMGPRGQMRPLGPPANVRGGVRAMGQPQRARPQMRPVRPRNPMDLSQGYVQPNQSYGHQQNQGYPQPVMQKGPHYAAQPRALRPGMRRAAPPGVRMMHGPMQPRMQPGMQVRPRLQAPHQRMGGPRPRMQVHMRGQGPVRGPMRPRGRARAAPRGAMRAARAQAPQILSVHSNRLTGIMNSQYADNPDEPDIVDLDDDDEDDILVPTLNTSYMQPAPDFDIIADDEMTSYNTSGEYIEDDYEEEPPKFMPQNNYQEVYDIE